MNDPVVREAGSRIRIKQSWALVPPAPTRRLGHVRVVSRIAARAIRMTGTGRSPASGRRRARRARGCFGAAIAHPRIFLSGRWRPTCARWSAGTDPPPSPRTCRRIRRRLRRRAAKRARCRERGACRDGRAPRGEPNACPSPNPNAPQRTSRSAPARTRSPRRDRRPGSRRRRRQCSRPGPERERASVFVSALRAATGRARRDRRALACSRDGRAGRARGGARGGSGLRLPSVSRRTARTGTSRRATPASARIWRTRRATVRPCGAWSRSMADMALMGFADVEVMLFQSKFGAAMNMRASIPLGLREFYRDARPTHSSSSPLADEMAGRGGAPDGATRARRHVDAARTGPGPGERGKGSGPADTRWGAPVAMGARERASDRVYDASRVRGTRA